MLGEKLRELRKQNSVTQAKLANYLNLDASSVAKYESGKVTPSPDILLKIAQYFNVSVDYLLGKEPDSNPPNDDAELDKFQFALFGTHDKISEEMIEDVKAYARFKLEQWKKQGKM
nr:helix-turn-helix transcriptional regulator [uncultured Butyricicoccus sp.]